MLLATQTRIQLPRSTQKEKENTSQTYFYSKEKDRKKHQEK